MRNAFKAPLTAFAFFLIASVCYAQDLPGLYPFTSTRALVDADVSDKDLATLKIMRNEIFARHGHTFKSEDLKTHFGSQAWYKATTPDATPLLSALEKKNADFIRQWETRITKTADFDDFYMLFSKAVEADDVKKLSDLVLIDFIESLDGFRSSYDRVKDDLRRAIDDGSPTGDDTVKKLFFGEFYSGVQYHWIEFHKEGCCWYIHGFGAAG